MNVKLAHKHKVDTSYNVKLAHKHKVDTSYKGALFRANLDSYYIAQYPSGRYKLQLPRAYYLARSTG